MDPSEIDAIQANPIGKHLDRVRMICRSKCEAKGIPCTPDTLSQLGQDELKTITVELVLSFAGIATTELLRSRTGRGTLRDDVFRLLSEIRADDFELNRTQPLLEAVLAEKLDLDIWTLVRDAVTEATPPPRPVASSLLQTPWLRNTGSFVNTSEYRKYVDDVLKEELGVMYVGIPGFHNAFFGRVAGLDTASTAVFNKCTEGTNPLFCEGWTGWPQDANEQAVLSWLAELIDTFTVFAEEYRPMAAIRRRPLAQPHKPIEGSTGERKLDVGFVNNPEAGKETRCNWRRILVPGELKSNPTNDIASKAWLDIGRYAREVLAAQDTRRFVLGFTICGSLMRVWEFDRLGGIASEQFDINKDGLQLVSTILGFLWMDEEMLGFDPTVLTVQGQKLINFEREGQTETFVIDALMGHSRCIAGRATTCWKAHREDDTQTTFVIKDSWQYTERGEEGELLYEATKNGVDNVARYHHHETVRIDNQDDDVLNNVRKGLDVSKAVNYPNQSSARITGSGAIRKSRGSSTGTAGVKRSSSQAGAGTTLPHSKRLRSSSKTPSNKPLPNRVHRRIVLRDYGRPIYEASSRSALLRALEGCIHGHDSLRKAGVLHRDISINNLMINEDKDNASSWPCFLIDLDLAIKEPRDKATGAKGKTGTRAFMAIGVLLGEQHSFMHDLESFFWVLLWICIHCDGPRKHRVVPRYEEWNYVDTERLARLKKGEISDEADFIRGAKEHFTPYYQPLIRCVNNLRKEVFPDGRRWSTPNTALYSRMKGVLLEAAKEAEEA